MTPQRDIATDSLMQDSDGGHALALARVLSKVFSPPLVGVACCLLVGFAATEPPGPGVMWALTILAVQLLPTVVLYIIRLRQGVYTDTDVSVRHQRNELYLLGSISVLASIALIVWQQAPRPLLALAVGALAIGLICGLVNLWWKISMHAATIGSVATVALLFSRPLGIVIWLCALAVGWARVRTRNHTPLQVLTGLIVGALVTIGAFLFVA